MHISGWALKNEEQEKSRILPWHMRRAMKEKSIPPTNLFEEVAKILKVLHYKKTLIYKDSWKKHGEVIGIFANISRKYDRIEAIIFG